VASLAIALVCFGSPAAAQSRAEEALEQYRAAEFEQAIELARAVLASEAEPADVARALEVLVLCYLGEGRDEPALNALRALSVVAREHTFLPETPPEIVERHRALAATQSQLVLEIDAARRDGSVFLSTTLTGAGSELVSRTVVHTRVGDGAWDLTTEGRRTLETDAPVAYYAEALGPGALVLARSGSEDDPFVLGPEEGAGDDGPSPWIFVGIGAGSAALIAIVVVVAVAAASGGGDTLVDGPVLR
jgi:hypothetical protein